MIDITISRPINFKTAISIMEGMTEEAGIKFTDKRIKMVAMDCANVAMAIMEIKANQCQKYEITEETLITLNLKNLKQILKRVTKDSDTLNFKLGQDEHLDLTINETRTFCTLILENEQEKEIPSLNPTTTIKLNNYKELIEDSKSILTNDEAVQFIHQDNTFKWVCKSKLMHNRLLVKDCEIISTEEETISKYPLEYLSKYTSGLKINPEAVLKFARDYPLQIDFKADNLLLRFITAPRCENY